MSVLYASHTITTAVQIGGAFLVSDFAFVYAKFKEHGNGW